MTEHSKKRTPPPAPKRVVLFVTCLVDQMAPEVGESVVRVLEKLGVEVIVPRAQTCCSQPAFNSGFRDQARPVAARFLDVFEGDDLIVTPSGSCAAMVRNYFPELFAADPVLLARSQQVAERVWEFSEFLVEVLGVSDVGGAFQVSTTYHKCCHLLRELGVNSQPETLLAGVKGLELKPLERAEVCCGFGGTFSVKMSDISTAMLNEKLDNAEKSGAQTVVAGDTGCIMHMNGGLRRRGSNIRAVHLAQLLDQAMSGNREPK